LLDLGGGPARVASRPLWPAFNTTDPLVATTLDLLPVHQDIAVSFPIRLQHLAVEHQPYFGVRWISRQAPASEYSLGERRSPPEVFTDPSHLAVDPRRRMLDALEHEGRAEPAPCRGPER
jgi:hypothetical protein